jgi:hypothetical protein
MRTALHYATSAVLHLTVAAFGPAVVFALIWMGAR